MSWVIARVEGKKLKRVSEEVGGYYPVMSRWTKPTGKRKGVLSEVPLFPGWLFVEMDRYPGLLNVPGVKGVIRYGKVVMELNDDDMARLREIEAEQGVSPDEDEEVEFKVGDLVQVIALNGIFGVITDLVGGQLARVEVEGRMKMTVHCCYLSKRDV